MLRGRTVGDGSLIGIQAVMLDGAKIGRGFECLAERPMTAAGKVERRVPGLKEQERARG